MAHLTTFLCQALIYSLNGHSDLDQCSCLALLSHKQKIMDILYSHFADKEESSPSLNLHKSPIDVLDILTFPKPKILCDTFLAY